MQITDHFHLDEFLVSQTAARQGIEIPSPPPEILENIIRLCELVLEPLRVVLDRPVIVTSGWRPSEVNRLVGGARNSQHLTGQAADIIVPGISVFAVATWLKHHNHHFDQLIDEFGRWVHVSVPAADDNPRGQILTARRLNGKTVYLRGLA